MEPIVAEWVSLRQAAEYLCVDHETVRFWVKRGVLTARRNRRQRLEVLRVELERALGRDGSRAHQPAGEALVSSAR